MLAPWFLAGLLAVALPLWLHRIAREQRIKLPFASLMLLQASQVRDTSQRRLRYWVLLALRIALLLALALAFAQPLWRSDSPPRTGDAQLHAIVLDASLSMQYGERWQRALLAAQQVIAQARSGDRLLLVRAGGHKLELLAGPVSAAESSRLRAALDTARPGLERLDFGLLMSGSKSWLNAEGLPTRLHLITDLQQSAAPLRFADLEPPPGTRIEFHDVGQADANAYNAGIGGIALQGAQERTLTARLHSFGPAPTTPREVVLRVDDRELARQLIPATQDNPFVVFNKLTLTPGAHRLQLSVVPHDTLPQDDDYFAAIEHTEPKVLLITRDPAADEAAYLAAAIEAQKNVPLTVAQSTPRTLAALLSKQPLAGFSAVVVADSGILAPTDAAMLDRYVRGGGAVLIALGAQSARQPQEPITGIALQKAVADDTRVATVDDSHPALRDASGWRAVRFLKHIAVRGGDTDRVLIAMEDRTPLLLERTGMAGRLLLLTAPFDRAFNDLAIHPVFVRFVADAARYLTSRDTSAMSYTVGGQITTGLLADSGGQIFDPQGARVLGLDAGARGASLAPEKLGFYEVRSSNRRRWLAVNTDGRESNLAPLTAATLERWQALSKPDAVAAVKTGDALADDSRKVQNLGVLLLWALAILAALELLLGNYRLTVRRDGATGAAPVTEGVR
jgi:hypothetical protein